MSFQSNQPDKLPFTLIAQDGQGFKMEDLSDGSVHKNWMQLLPCECIEA